MILSKMKCCVRNCGNKYNQQKKRGFFSFPKGRKLQEKWLDFCGIPKTAEASRSWKICMDHFQNEEIIGKTQCEFGFSRKLALKPGAVPSISEVQVVEGEREPRLSNTKRCQVTHTILKEKTENTNERDQEVDLTTFFELDDEVVTKDGDYEIEMVLVQNCNENYEDNFIMDHAENEIIHKNDDLQLKIKTLRWHLKTLQHEHYNLTKSFHKREKEFIQTLEKKNSDIEKLKVNLLKKKDAAHLK